MVTVKGLQNKVHFLWNYRFISEQCDAVLQEDACNTHSFLSLLSSVYLHLFLSLFCPCSFLVPSHRSVGTFARALDCSSSVRQPSLHMSAAAASRDITLVRHHLHSLAHSLHTTSCFRSTSHVGLAHETHSNVICALPIVHAELLIMA